jgi:hypothetical protein
MKGSARIIVRRLTITLAVCLLTGCGPVGTAPKAGKTTVSANRVPVVVKQALEAKFPAAKTPEWKVKSETIYEAEFTLKGIETTVMFDSNGKWLETETAIDPAQVPKVVTDAAARQFKGYKVIETQSVQRRDTEHLIYELHFEDAKRVVKAQFSSEGAVLTQSVKVKS